MKISLCLLLPLWLFAQSFSVASYNLFNLFDGTVQGSEYPDFQRNWSGHSYKQKLDKIVHVLQKLDADIVALQEVENRGVVHKLAQRCGYPHFAVTSMEDSAIQLGFLSRFPITYTREIKVPEASRNILQIRVSVQEHTLELFNNHWRSRRGPEKERIAYAKALRKELDPSREYILLGDFNSNYDTGFADRPSGIGDILRTQQNKIPLTQSQLRLSTHYNLWLELPLRQRFSYFYRGRPQTLDAILLPATLFDRKGLSYTDNSFAVFKPEFLIKGKRINKSYSDHLPVYARFHTGAFEQKALPEGYGTVPIDALYKTSTRLPKRLEKVVVLQRDRYGAVIKKQGSKAIYIYEPDNALKKGYRYDLLVYETGNYHGVHEIKRYTPLRRHGTAPTAPLYLDPRGKDLNDPELIHEVIFSLRGRYESGRFYYEGGSLPVYFRDKTKKPRRATAIILKDVRIHRYKGTVQLLVTHSSEVIIP